MNSMNRVGLFPYVADELNIKALKYLLPRSGTGFSIVHTRDGYAILVNPETDLKSARGKLKRLGLYGHLCSKKDGGKQIRIIRKPSSDQRIPWAAMIEAPFFISYEQDELEKLQDFLYPYLEDGTISSMELDRTMLAAAEDPEDTLKSMQLDVENSPWHLHIEYDPLFIMRFGYIPSDVNENDLEIIPKEALNNLGNLTHNKISQDMNQIFMRLASRKMRWPDRQDMERDENFNMMADCLKEITENIPVFMTQEIRQKLEEETEKNVDYLTEMIGRTLSYLNGMNIIEFK